jgi:hypothetical protein
MRKAILGLLLTFSVVGSGSADELVRTTDGREILLRDDGTYEFVSSAEAVDGYRAMAFEDLRLDIDELRGQRVEVVANVSTMGGMLLLTDPRIDMDMNPIFAEEGDLSRDERRQIISRCNMSCRLTVRGEVSSIMFQSGLRLHSLVQ